MQKQMTDAERKQTIQKLQGIINRIEQRERKEKGNVQNKLAALSKIQIEIQTQDTFFKT